MNLIPQKLLQLGANRLGGHASSRHGARRLGRAFLHLSRRPKTTATINIDRSIEHGAVIPNILESDVGVSIDIGKREYQEDRYTVYRIDDDVLFLGIYDGHGGSLAADYAAANLHLVTASLLQTRTQGVQDTLITAFCEVNNNLLQFIRKNRPKKEHYSGTTATACLLVGNVHLHTASVGDSRAILGRRGQAVALTDDHHPERDDERARVEAQGGTIISNSLGTLQVDGRLTMTRSIGDFDLKHHGVTAVPEYRYKKLNHSSDAFLALVTDGVTFSMTNSNIAGVVSSQQTSQEAADALTDHALQLGSLDNCTALVLPLGAWRQRKIDQSAVKFQLGSTLSRRD